MVVKCLFMKQQEVQMQSTKLISIQAAALLLYSILVILLIPDPNYNTAQSLHDCHDFSAGWTIQTDNIHESAEKLPSLLHTDNERDVWLRRTLTDVADGDCIGFFSFQQQVDISLDGETVYTFLPKDYMNSDTPGNKWHFFQVNSDDNGKELTIHIRQCYFANRISIPKIYYGSESGIIMHYIIQEVPHIALSLIMILFGVILFVFCIPYRKKPDFEKGLLWLSFFAVFRGMWTFIEANVYTLVLTHYLLLSHVSYLCLKLSVAAFLQFINVSFHNGANRPLKYLTLASVAEFWVTGILQLVFAVDFANTIAVTYLILLLGGIIACHGSIHAAVNPPPLSFGRRQSSYIARTACTIVIIAASIADLVRYYTVTSPDIAFFSRWGDFIYVCTMSATFVLDFVTLVRIGYQAQQIKEEAEQDPMTKIKNRACFERDIMSGCEKQWKRQSIVVIDLNNLKLFNDEHGHGMGDYYIIVSSEIIYDSYSPYGCVYRIGGDEFCVIATDLSEDNFLKIRDAAENYLETLRMPNYQLHMELSAGYAAFNSKFDYNLRDTMKRADELMYQRKTELKKANASKNPDTP